MADRERFVELVGSDWRSAGLAPEDEALCEYAVKLTERPAEMLEQDVERLRAHGYDDYDVHDAIQVVSYFNYINRVADAVHVDLEPEMAPYPGEESADSSAGSAGS